MLEKLLRELKKLEGGLKIPVGIPVDDDGFLDRCCPAKPCGWEFKVLCENWLTKAPDAAACCPFCGDRDSSGNFATTDQLDYIWGARVRTLVGRADVRADRGSRPQERDAAR